MAGSGVGARTVASDHLGKDLPVKRSPLAALALLLALACASCSDDDPEPKIAPPESSSPAPTETETTSEPPEPLDPEETVRAWVEARNVAMATGEVTDLQALSADDCTSCVDQIEPIKQIYEAGGHFETMGWRVKSSTIDTQTSSTATVSTALIIAGGRTFPERGADPVVYGEEKRIAIFEMGRTNGTWSVTLIGFAR
jgi:hypothetical protein